MLNRLSQLLVTIVALAVLDAATPLCADEASPDERRAAAESAAGDAVYATTVNVTHFVGPRHEGYGEIGMAHRLEHPVCTTTPGHPDITE